MTEILAVSGSPIKNGNIERAIQHMIQSSGIEGELIRLNSLSIKPCMACLKCVDTNRCVQSDDMNEILDRVLNAKAVIIGGFPTFFSLNSTTKLFMERMFPLKHNKMLTKGKLGVAVAGGFRDATVVQQYLCSFFEWMKMTVVGSLTLGGNAPCLSCGSGETCEYSNFTMEFGVGAHIAADHFYRFENDLTGYEKAALIGERLGDILKGRRLE